MEHGFEEAFFESSGDEEEEKESVLVQSVETTKYKVRECEPEVFKKISPWYRKYYSVIYSTVDSTIYHNSHMIITYSGS